MDTKSQLLIAKNINSFLGAKEPLDFYKLLDDSAINTERIILNSSSAINANNTYKWQLSGIIGDAHTIKTRRTIKNIVSIKMDTFILPTASYDHNQGNRIFISIDEFSQYGYCTLNQQRVQFIFNRTGTIASNLDLLEGKLDINPPLEYLDTITIRFLNQFYQPLVIGSFSIPIEISYIE